MTQTNSTDTNEMQGEPMRCEYDGHEPCDSTGVRDYKRKHLKLLGIPLIPSHWDSEPIALCTRHSAGYELYTDELPPMPPEAQTYLDNNRA